MNDTDILRTLRAVALTALAAITIGSVPVLADDEEHDEDIHITVWEDGIEVFAEYPPLVANGRAQIVAYVTLLDGYRAAHQGRLKATLRARDGSARAASVSNPAGKGIYVLGVTPAQAGEHTLDLVLELPQRSHHARLPLIVHEHQAAAVQEHEHEHSDDIVFTKSQQSLIPFAAEAARREPIAERFTTPAAVEAAAGRRAEVNIPAQGVLHGAGDRPWPQAGQRVRRGEPLAMLQTLAGIDDVAALASAAEIARERLNVAESQLARIAQLAAEGVVAERRLIEARAEKAGARAEWRAASARLSAVRGDAGGDSLTLAAPLDGVIIESALAPGQAVEAGARLASVIDARTVVIRVDLLAADAEVIADVQDLRLRRPGGREWLTPQTQAIHRAAALDASGVLTLRYEVDNDGGWLPGLPLIASLPVSAATPRITVPESAVIDDDGIAVVIVQHGGESFERRAVRIGPRAAGRVAIAEGLDGDERIVSTGAYAVMLAGRGPAGDAGHHGHSH